MLSVNGLHFKLYPQFAKLNIGQAESQRIISKAANVRNLNTNKRFGLNGPTVYNGQISWEIRIYSNERAKDGSYLPKNLHGEVEKMTSHMR